jgi:ATP-binding cassette subfamily B protein
VRGDLAFVDVTFAYPNGTAALDHLDLTVGAGETVAVVGGTGSGKSTLGRLAARFYDVTSGRVTIDGTDVRKIKLSALREQVGIVPDEPFLFSLSIHDNIAYGRPHATRREVIEAAVAAGADEFILELPEGYETVVGERGYTLSGGQRQRIAIARALIVDPPILVLDDATSAIDVGVEQRIHGTLRERMRGRTTLIVAHRLSTISLADRVVLMADGRVIADGTHSSLLASEPRYAEVLAAATSSAEEVSA